MIYNRQNEDITDLVYMACDETGVAPYALVGLMIAESNLFPYAQRYGLRTQEAKGYIRRIESGDSSAYDPLQQLIYDVWADVSFSYGQRVVLYHYAGDRTASVDNVLYVRNYVFTHLAEEIFQTAHFFAAKFRQIEGQDLSPVDYDPVLGALVAYNAGSLKPPGDPWWQRWAGNVANYRWALQEAQQMIDPEFENWLELYRNAHGGMGPAAWENRKHLLAITGTPPTPEDMAAIQTDLEAIQAQYALITGH